MATQHVGTRMQKHIPALDGVRGIAILLVMIFHFRVPPDTAALEVWNHVVSVGWCGVDLFFVLSGFLITGILIDAKGSSAYFRNFYIRRTLRIFPLYYGLLFVVFALVPAVLSVKSFQPLVDRQGWFWLYGTNFLITLQGIDASSEGPVSLTHLWSLAVEEHFYLVWPAVVFLCSRSVFPWVCAAFVVVAVLFRSFLVLGDENMAAYCLTPSRMDSLVAGALLAWWARAERPGPSDRTILGLVWGCFAALAALIWWRSGLHSHDAAVQVLGYPILTIAFAGLVFHAIRPVGSSRLRRVLCSRVLTSIGKYAYGLYMFHWLLLPLFIRYGYGFLKAHGWPPAAAAVGHLVFAFTVTFAVAWTSWHLYEKRLLSLKRFFEYREAAPRTTTTA